MYDPYLIVDGGYHNWRHLMAGFGPSTDPAEQAWTVRLTSARKDVECAFGILKRRFRILKIPLQFHDATTINNIFRTCVVLHNMCLVHNGRRFVGHSRALALDGDHSGLHNSLAGVTITRQITGQGRVPMVIEPGCALLDGPCALVPLVESLCLFVC